ncbi:MAG TPA: hypothetical protein VN655_16735 [Pseudolabrys sp.]|nr:hypothetical protein [Pseudolabrys sp.]
MTQADAVFCNRDANCPAVCIWRTTQRLRLKRTENIAPPSTPALSLSQTLSPFNLFQIYFPCFIVVIHQIDVASTRYHYLIFVNTTFLCVARMRALDAGSMPPATSNVFRRAVAKCYGAPARAFCQSSSDVNRRLIHQNLRGTTMRAHRSRQISVALISAAAFLVACVATISVSTPASAKPEFAAQTGLPCGQCHVNAAGSGKLKPFGEKFKENGYKVKK